MGRPLRIPVMSVRDSGIPRTVRGCVFRVKPANESKLASTKEFFAPRSREPLALAGLSYCNAEMSYCFPALSYCKPDMQYNTAGLSYDSAGMSYCNAAVSYCNAGMLYCIPALQYCNRTWLPSTRGCLPPRSAIASTDRQIGAQFCVRNAGRAATTPPASRSHKSSRSRCCGRIRGRP
jgi:hypothetical protein